MNRASVISFYKKQIENAKELKEVSMQNYNIATRLESEAKRALEMLGNTPKPTRKGVLPKEEILKLKANLTK